MRKKIFIFKLAKHIFVMLRGILKGAKPFLIHLGSKCIYRAIVLFFSSYLFLFFSSYSSRTIFFLFLHILIFLYLNVCCITDMHIKHTLGKGTYINGKINDLQRKPRENSSLAKIPPKYSTAYIVQQSNCRWHCEATCFSS